MTTFVSKKKIPDHSGSIGANNDIVYELPVGPTYQGFQIVTNIAAQHLTYELELNGEIIVKLTGTQLDMLDAYYGVAKETDIFNLNLGFEHVRDPANTFLTSLATLESDNVYLRVKIGATAVGSPTHKVYGKTTPAQDSRLYVPRFKPVQMPIAGTGENEYLFKRRGRQPGDIRFAAIHLAGAVTNVEIEQDDLTQFNLPIAVNHAGLAQSKFIKRVPQSGYYHLDFMQDGNVRDIFDTFSVESLMLKLTTSDANAVTGLVQSIEVAGASATA